MNAKLRRFVLVSAVAVAAFAVVPAAPAAAYSQCLAGQMCGWLFYSDAARTHLQGGHTTNCEGSVLDWGIKSGYSTFISQGCADLPPGGPA